MENKLASFRHLLVFVLAYTLFVRGVGLVVNLADIRDLYVEDTGYSKLSINTAINSLQELLKGSTGLTKVDGELTGFYQVLIFVVMSMSTLWFIRALHAKKEKLKAQDAYYYGSAQIVPFMLILLVLGIQLLPITLANAVIATVQASNLISSPVDALWVFVIVASLVLLSLYLTITTFFAFIVITIPGARPMQALRSSADLVRHRRMGIMRQLLVTILLTGIIGVAILLPVVLLIAPAAEYVFYVLSAATFMFLHVYLYELYKDLMEKP